MNPRLTRRFWVDENLPCALCGVLAAREGTSAHHFLSLGIGETSDSVIWRLARVPGTVIVSKDGDFAEPAAVHGPPPQVIWVRTGNASTKALVGLFEVCIDNLLTALDHGEPVIMVGS